LKPAVPVVLFEALCRKRLVEVECSFVDKGFHQFLTLLAFGFFILLVPIFSCRFADLPVTLYRPLSHRTDELLRKLNHASTQLLYLFIRGSKLSAGVSVSMCQRDTFKVKLKKLHNTVHYRQSTVT